MKMKNSVLNKEQHKGLLITVMKMKNSVLNKEQHKGLLITVLFVYFLL